MKKQDKFAVLNLLDTRQTDIFLKKIGEEQIIKERNSNTSSSSSSNKSEGSGCGAFLFIFVALIFAGVSSIKSCYNNAIGNYGGYITTLQSFPEYSKIEDKPLGKEVGKIPADNVLLIMYKRFYPQNLYAYD